MLLLGPILLCLSIGQATAQSLASASAPPTVTNPSTGVSFQGTLSSGIESFYNIRFGEDTSGPNRFTLPKAFKYPRKTVVNASTFGDNCPQAITAGIFANPSIGMSEDCLTLRVDRLSHTTADAKLPVMIWLFGGGFTSGTIYEDSYDPTGLLEVAEVNGSPVIFAALMYVHNAYLPSSLFNSPKAIGSISLASRPLLLSMTHSTPGFMTNDWA